MQKKPTVLVTVHVSLLNRWILKIANDHRTNMITSLVGSRPPHKGGGKQGELRYAESATSLFHNSHITSIEKKGKKKSSKAQTYTHTCKHIPQLDEKGRTHLHHEFLIAHKSREEWDSEKNNKEQHSSLGHVHPLACLMDFTQLGPQICHSVHYVCSTLEQGKRKALLLSKWEKNKWKHVERCCMD